MLVEEGEGEVYGLADSQLGAAEVEGGHLRLHGVDDETTGGAPWRTGEAVVDALHRPVVGAAGQPAEVMGQIVSGVARAEGDVAGEHVAAAGEGADAQVVGEAGGREVEFVFGPLPAELHSVARIDGGPDARALRRAVRVELGFQIVVDYRLGQEICVSSGRNQVEIAIPFDIGEGYGAEIQALEDGDIVEDQGVIPVLVHAHEGILTVVAGDDQVEVLVVVVVAPGQIAAADTGQVEAGQRFQVTAAVVDVEGGAHAVVADAAGDQVGISIAVEIGPGQIARLQAGQVQLRIDQAAVVVAVDAQFAAAGDARAGHRQIEVLVVVVVCPGQVAVVEADEILVAAREGPEAVVDEDPGVGLLHAVEHVVALAGECQVEIAVVVVVAPGCSTLR